jgi:hypothetical protein
MAGDMAVDIYCHRKARNVGGELLDMHSQSGSLTAEALGADAESIDPL